MLRNKIATLDGLLTQFFTGTTVGTYCEIKGRAGNKAFDRSRARAAGTVRTEGAIGFAPGLSDHTIGTLVKILDDFETLRDTGEQSVAIESWMLPALTLRADTVRLSAEPSEVDGGVRSAEAEVLKALENELGLSIERLGITLYRNRSTDDVRILSADWHFDRRPTDWMRAFVYLSDVDPDCGPFHYFSRRQSTAFCRRGFRRVSPEWQRRVEQSGSFRKLLGARGAGLIANAERILHRAGVPAADRHRDMFEVIFRPAR